MCFSWFRAFFLISRSMDGICSIRWCPVPALNPAHFGSPLGAPQHAPWVCIGGRARGTELATKTPEMPALTKVCTGHGQNVKSTQ